jgi:delta 1-pyrroline-5-carboxylate dehydrogenase
MNNGTFCIGFGTEKTCTINTTAIGGNASLLELGATDITKN